MNFYLLRPLASVHPAAEAPIGTKRKAKRMIKSPVSSFNKNLLQKFGKKSAKFTKTDKNGRKYAKNGQKWANRIKNFKKQPNFSPRTKNKNSGRLKKKKVYVLYSIQYSFIQFYTVFNTVSVQYSIQFYTVYRICVDFWANLYPQNKLVTLLYTTHALDCITRLRTILYPYCILLYITVPYCILLYVIVHYT